MCGGAKVKTKEKGGMGCRQEHVSMEEMKAVAASCGGGGR